MTRNYLLQVSALLIALPVSLSAQTANGHGAYAGPTLRVMQAARRSGPIAIDGRLDDAAWKSAPVARDFTQSYPDPGKPPVDQTEVRILYDNDALYVGVRMFDAHPDSIAAQLARRDASGIYSDWLHVMIDSYHDRRTAYRFSVNPRGVQKDVFTSDNSEDLNWDAVWDVATRVDSLGWVAEYRIPLSQLRFGNAQTDDTRVWGVQIMRDVARRAERDSWSPWTPQSPGFVSSFGDLVGMHNVPAPKRLDVLPYASSKVTRAPGDPADPFYHHTSAKPSAGADLRVGLPAGLTLTGTINPDFGQVEVDPEVVNLSAYETFFPEKRPFFLEGADIFNFGQVRRQSDFSGQYFFYSRRIGRAPQLYPTGDVAFADIPTQTTIVGAAKITGKAGPWSIGVLNAVTAEEKADVAATSGVERKAPVEPLTNYFAARLKRDFRSGRSFVGGMLTSTMRNMSDSVFEPRLRAHATFGGVDFEHDVRHRTWIVSGFLAASRVTGSKSAIAQTQRNSTHYFQRPDADYITYDPTRTSLDGHIAELAIQKTGANWGSLALKETSPGLELNDFGYIGRADYRAVSSIIGHQSIKAGKYLRNYNLYAYQNSAWNYGGDAIFHAIQGRANATFNNLWSANIGAGRNFRASDDLLLRGGPAALSPAGWSAQGSLDTDTRWPVIVDLTGSYQQLEFGSKSSSLYLTFDMRPATNVHVTMGPSYRVSRSTSQYLRAVTDANAAATYGARYVFASLSQRTLSMDMRVEWTFTPTLSLQTYVQPFVSAGDYSAIKEFRRPGTLEFDVYGIDRGTIAYDSAARQYQVDPDAAGPSPSFVVGNPDFNVRSLRGNAVLRWQYRPGSALFFVWQQERSEQVHRGDFQFGRDTDAIFRTRPTNVFLVKATYWIGH